jgi:hypothetical protein
MASRRREREGTGGARAGAVQHDGLEPVSGMAILDVGRSDRAVLEALEPRTAVRAAAEWGALMDGRMEVREGGVVWVPGEYARRFGFIEFRVPPEDVARIHVPSQPSLRGTVDIDLAGEGTVTVRVPDPDRWRIELERASGL